MVAKCSAEAPMGNSMPRGCDTRSYARHVDLPLTPAQADTLAMLRGEGPRPTFDPALRVELRACLEEGIGDLAILLERPLWAGKTPLGRVFACEAHEVAEQEVPFDWNLANARGTVAHRAIELSVHLDGAPPPLHLVDTAIARMADDPDSGIGGFLARLDAADLAELRSDVNNLVSDFLDQWPPLKASWRPTTEARLKAELCKGKVVVSGKADLALGAPVGTEAGRVFVELKSGAARAQHLDDLRLYALLETLRIGVPPRRLAVHSLDSGSLLVVDVNLDVLQAAVHRTIDGLRTLLELHLGLRSAQVTPNPTCRWCSAREHCEGAVRWAEGDPFADEV